MKEGYARLSPRGKAQSDYRQGSGHDANPYTKGTPEREEYMLEMGRLQALELRAMLEELRAGV
jgi:hypothetical protein